MTTQTKTKGEEIMTDKQMEFIISLVVGRIENCKNMEEVQEAIDDLKVFIREELKNKD